MSTEFEVAAFDKLVKQALDEIETMPVPAIQFCGPISTGGFGSVEDNLFALKQTIHETANTGISVFDQLKYETDFHAILKDFKGEYDFPILKYFYEPIFRSTKIKALFFLPLWDTSYGSIWERDLAQSLGIHAELIETMLLSEVKAKYEALKIQYLPLLNDYTKKF